MCGYESKLIFDKNRDKAIKADCNRCKKVTNHSVLRDVDDSWSDYDDEGRFGIDGYTKYQIIKCGGCDNISFRIDSYFSEDDSPTITLFPKVDYSKKELLYFESIPDQVSIIYSETISAYNTGSSILCAAGLRAIVEAICHDKKISGGFVYKTAKLAVAKPVFSKKLDGKIAGLCENKHLTQQHADILHEHRYLGNEALHELSPPGKKELDLAIEIIEHTLRQMYDLPNKAEELKKHKIRRKGRKP